MRESHGNESEIMVGDFTGLVVVDRHSGDRMVMV